MHVQDGRAFTRLDEAREHISRCEVFATEFDFSDLDQGAMSMALQLPEGATLDQLLGRQAWKNLERYAQKHLGIPAEALLHQHPMNVGALLTAALMKENSPASLDETLWQFARQQGVETAGVETFAEQIETLGKIPFEAHVKNLVWLLKNYNRQKRRLRKMLDRYAEGDIQKLYESAKREAKGMRRVLLYERNKIMARRFAEIARDRALFCAVGAGHLAGEKGMLRLLKKAGFIVKPVLPAPSQ